MDHITFEKAENAEQMISYLKRNGKFTEDQYFYQYMNFGKLQSILLSKSWRFSKPARMNDKYEYGRFTENSWEGKYYGCFMKTHNESVAMWSMYGQPWDSGIRIGIRADMFRKWISSIDHVEDGAGNVYVEQAYYAAVSYYDEDAKCFPLRNGRKNEKFDPYGSQKMAGFVKDIAWDYEKEVRIHVDTKEDFGDAIYVNIPDYVYENMIVTIGPRSSEEVVKMWIDDVSAYSIPVNKSRLYEKIQWVYCDVCKR